MRTIWISADEKSQLQRCHGVILSCRPVPDGLGGWSSSTAHGTLAYFGACDVHRARLMGRVEPNTGIEPFGALVEHVMRTEPYASAKRVFWVVDNGSSHAGQARSTGCNRPGRTRTGAPTDPRLLAQPDPR